jgi:hypothetical protein
MANGCQYHLAHSKKSHMQPQRHGLGLFKRDKSKVV